MEKQSIFDLESVTLEYPETVTKLSKLNIITQKPNKIRIYTESKASDHALQLDIVKTYFLPKNSSQSYEIKISSSEKYDEQLNLARSSIKNKFFDLI